MIVCELTIEGQTDPRRVYLAHLPRVVECIDLDGERYAVVGVVHPAVTDVNKATPAPTLEVRKA